MNLTDYLQIAGFTLDFYVMSLFVIMALRLISNGMRSEEKSSRQYNIGIGFFFIAVTLSALIYGIDLVGREFFDGRIFPAGSEYEAMGFVFDSFHMQSYYIAVLAVILFALGALIKPIEENILQREKPVVSLACFIGVPIPIILRGLELIVLPQEGSVVYWIFSGVFIVLWLVIFAGILTLGGLYLKIARNSAGLVKQRAIAILVGFFIWILTIFSRPSILKDLGDIPWLFFVLPTVSLIMFRLLLFGFHDNIKLEAEEKRGGELHFSWGTKVVLYTSLLVIGIYLSIIYWDSDLEVVHVWTAIAADNPLLKEFGDFMDRSGIEGGDFGAGDITYIMIIICAVGYLAMLVPAVHEKLKDSKFRMYAGYIITSSIVLALINRVFKAFFGRVRPGSVGSIRNGVVQEFSHMWQIGSQDFSTAFSRGSFTSGHTTTAVIMVAIAFILLTTKKKSIIIPAFAVTFIWTGLMAFGRIVSGHHYPGDVIWAGIKGIYILAFMYFVVLKIPEQERGEFTPHAKLAEIRWGFLFLFFTVGLLAFLFGIKYTFFDAEFVGETLQYLWYASIVVGPILCALVYNRMHWVLHGKYKFHKKER